MSAPIRPILTNSPRNYEAGTTVIICERCRLYFMGTIQKVCRTCSVKPRGLWFEINAKCNCELPIIRRYEPYCLKCGKKI